MPENSEETPKTIDAPPPKRQDKDGQEADTSGPEQDDLDAREQRVLERERKPMGPPPEESEGDADEGTQQPPDVSPTAPEPA
jgi:hypothetical protein